MFGDLDNPCTLTGIGHASEGSKFPEERKRRFTHSNSRPSNEARSFKRFAGHHF